jgi:hypothetical protein
MKDVNTQQQVASPTCLVHGRKLGVEDEGGGEFINKEGVAV